MKIIINENSSISETEIIVNCRQTDEQILRIISMLRVYERKITGIYDGQTFLLNTTDILYIDTVDKKTFLYTNGNVYETPHKLFELESRLSSEDFFRASKSSIINFSKVKSLRPEFGGRMLLTMCNDEKLYVSRQYVPTIKQKLGIK